MIETARLLLIPITIEMIDSLLESDEAFLNHFGYINNGGEYLNPSPEYLQKVKDELIANPEVYPLAVDYLIVIKEIKTVIGSIDFKYLPKDGVSEIGYGMTPTYEGNGYMTEAVQAMLEYGKINGISTVVADTLKQNIKSQKVLLRNGFRQDKIVDNMIWFIKEL